jgi:chromosome segregation ATPase
MSEKPMFEDCTTGLTCSAIEAEMRDRLAAKDARIAELASAVAGKVQLIEPDPETIAWAEGVFAAEDDKNATIEDLSRKLEASRHRVAELEARFANIKQINRDHERDLDQAQCSIDAKDTRIAELEASLRAAIKSHDKIPANIPVPGWVESAKIVLEGKQNA